MPLKTVPFRSRIEKLKAPATWVAPRSKTLHNPAGSASTRGHTMATRCYKLTTQENTTKNNTLWGEGVTHKTSGEGALCTGGWLHAYTDPLLAILLNPVHANIKNPKLWLAYGSGKYNNDKGLKIGFSQLKTVKELPLLEVTETQRTAFGILCALEVCKDSSFAQWANDWLSGKDRSQSAAYAPHAAHADYASDTAASAAYASYAAYAAASDTTAAYSASAASAAASAAYSVNLKKLARKAMKVN